VRVICLLLERRYITWRHVRALDWLGGGGGGDISMDPVLVVANKSDAGQTDPSMVVTTATAVNLTVHQHFHTSGGLVVQVEDHTFVRAAVPRQVSQETLALPGSGFGSELGLEPIRPSAHSVRVFLNGGGSYAGRDSRALVCVLVVASVASAWSGIHKAVYGYT
jgi:hypothetical protein